MVNYLAVLVAAIVAFGVGALWYGPLFGKKWRELMGVGAGSMGSSNMSMSQAMVGGFIATLVMTYVLATLLIVAGAFSITSAVIFAICVWLGFVAMILMNSVWYENRSWALYFINASHYLVAIVVAAIILAWWPW